MAFWLTIGWFTFGSLIIDPYYDRKLDAVIASAPQNAPTKKEVDEVERERSSIFKGVGVFGGVLCGFAFGVAARSVRHRFPQLVHSE